MTTQAVSWDATGQTGTVTLGAGDDTDRIDLTGWDRILGMGAAGVWQVPNANLATWTAYNSNAGGEVVDPGASTIGFITRRALPPIARLTSSGGGTFTIYRLP